MTKRKRGSGEGSIYKLKDGRWRAAVSVGWKDGKRVRKTFTGKTRHAVAEQMKVALRSQQQGLPIAPERQAVGPFLDAWLEDSARPSVRPRTYIFYESIVRLHLKPVLGNVPLQKLEPQHVQRLMNQKLESGLSPRMVRHIHRTLTTALQVAERYGRVPRNVAKLTDPPTAPRPEVKFFTIEQARRFLAAVKAHRLCALYTVSLALGLRLGEALGLRWADVDLETGRLTVRYALQRIKKDVQLVEPKSATSRRTVTFPAFAISALQHHKAKQQSEIQWAGSGWKGNDWGLVFTSTVGTPLFARNVHRQFKNILVGADLPDLRLHDLRHSAAAILIAQGVSAKAISALLGHSAASFTLQVYGHLMEETKREVATQMDAALNPVATQVATKPSERRVQ